MSPFAETGMIMQSNYGKPDLVEHYHYLLISFLKRAHSGVESGHKDFDLIAKNIIKMESELHQTMSIPFSDLYPEVNYIISSWFFFLGVFPPAPLSCGHTQRILLKLLVDICRETMSI